MDRTILVPLDGSPLAERALPYAEALAEVSRARLLLVRATVAPVGPSVDQTRDEARAIRAAESYLGDVAETIGKARLVETATFCGDAADAIVEEARLRKANLIVMSTHGRSGLGRWIYGSVADAVIRRADVPVMLIPATCQRAWENDQPLRVVVPLDRSPLAESAVECAIDLTASTSERLLLLHALDGHPDGDFDLEAELADAQRYEDTIADIVRKRCPAVETCTVIGDAVPSIAQATSEWQGDLIVMATHGGSSPSPQVMGSTASAVVQQSSVPVLLVRPTVREVPPPMGVSVARI